MCWLGQENIGGLEWGIPVCKNRSTMLDTSGYSSSFLNTDF